MTYSFRCLAARDAHTELVNLSSRLSSNPLSNRMPGAPDFKHWLSGVSDYFTKAESRLTAAGLLDQRERLARAREIVTSIDTNEGLPGIVVTFDNADSAALTIMDARDAWAARHGARLQTAGKQVEVLDREVRDLWEALRRSEDKAERSAKRPDEATPAPAERPTHATLVLDGLIGSGSFADVWRGHDELRRLAVKLCRPEDGFAPRALDHARALADVSHPNIAQVHFVGRTHDPHTQHLVDFVAMELIDGPTLGEHLRQLKTALALESALQVGKGILDAVAHLHAKDIPHSDLHVDNVMLAEGIPKLIDPIFRGTLRLTSARLDYRLRSDLHDVANLLVELLEKAGVPPPISSDFHRAAFLQPITPASIRIAFDHALQATVSIPSALKDFATRVGVAARRRGPVDITDGFSAAVLRPVTEILRLLREGAPPELNSAGTHRPLLETLRSFEGAVLNDREAAEEADRALSRGIRRHNHAKSWIAINDMADRTFFVGRSLGLPDEEILPVVDMPLKAAETRLFPTYEAMRATAEVAGPVAEFLKARGCLLQSLHALRELTETREAAPVATGSTAT